MNNTVARAGSLLAVAILPALAGITGSSYLHPGQFEDGFTRAAFISALVCACGGVLAFATIRNPRRAVAGIPPRVAQDFSCPLDAPPLRSRTPASQAPEPVTVPAD